MLLSDIKRKHSFMGRIEGKTSFQGEIHKEHVTGPQDQNINPFPLILLFWMYSFHNPFDLEDLFMLSLLVDLPWNDIIISVLPLRLCFLFISESSIYRYYPEFISQILKWFFSKKFSKYICFLFFCWYILQFYYLLSHLFSKKMILDWDMFSF